MYATCMGMHQPWPLQNIVMVAIPINNKAHNSGSIDEKLHAYLAKNTIKI